MKSLLVLVILGAVAVSMCHGACYQQKSLLYCVYSRQTWPRRMLIPVGTTKRIRRDCKKCTCFPDGVISCCDVYGGFADIPDYCEIKQRGCRQRVVMKNNPRRKCTGPVSIVGR